MEELEYWWSKHGTEFVVVFPIVVIVLVLFGKPILRLLKRIFIDDPDESPAVRAAKMEAQVREERELVEERADRDAIAKAAKLPSGWESTVTRRQLAIAVAVACAINIAVTYLVGHTSGRDTQVRKLGDDIDDVDQQVWRLNREIEDLKYRK